MRKLHTSKYFFFFFFVKGLMGNGRPLLSFQQIYTWTNTTFFTCTKIVSADMLERNCCTFVLGLTTGLNNYRPTYVPTGCSK